MSLGVHLKGRLTPCPLGNDFCIRLQTDGLAEGRSKRKERMLVRQKLSEVFWASAKSSEADNKQFCVYNFRSDQHHKRLFASINLVKRKDA